MANDELSVLNNSMEEAMKALQRSLSGLRTGRAMPSLLETLTVEAYGGRMALSQLGNISAPEPRLLSVQVWDTSMVAAVEKAIRASGLSPIVEGAVLRVPIPELSQERRKEMAKMAKTYGEEGKVGIRNLRRMALDALAKEDISEDDLFTKKREIQKITDDFIIKIQDMVEKKEKEIMVI